MTATLAGRTRPPPLGRAPRVRPPRCFRRSDGSRRPPLAADRPGTGRAALVGTRTGPSPDAPGTRLTPVGPTAWSDSGPDRRRIARARPPDPRFVHRSPYLVQRRRGAPRPRLAGKATAMHGSTSTWPFHGRVEVSGGGGVSAGTRRMLPARVALELLDGPGVAVGIGEEGEARAPGTLRSELLHVADGDATGGESCSRAASKSSTTSWTPLTEPGPPRGRASPITTEHAEPRGVICTTRMLVIGADIVVEKQKSDPLGVEGLRHIDVRGLGVPPLRASSPCSLLVSGLAAPPRQPI